MILIEKMKIGFFLILGVVFISCTQVEKQNLKNTRNGQAQLVQKVRPNWFSSLTPMTEKGRDKLCQKVKKKWVTYHWGKSYCDKVNWMQMGESHLKTPLGFVVYGNPQIDLKKADTTLIFCGVHGDEITPVKFCFDVMNYLENLGMNDEHNHFKDHLVIVAPIANPDSFFKKYPSRTNHKGIDINRNLPTKDFSSDAIRLWKSRYRKDGRRFPGETAGSEPETQFQLKLMETFGPEKIISVHSPLTMLDYDGPMGHFEGGEIGTKANQLLIQMAESARGYRIKNYPFFPGSLGNYAGNERNIPTYTLELPSSDNRKSKQYWKLFKSSIHSAIFHKMKRPVASLKTETVN